jgi:UPF0271 protein
MTVDLNADLGEGAGIDDELMTLISSANVSCGAHAGDEAGIRRTLAAAKLRGVQVGAHPSYPDRANFGRLEMNATPDVIQAFVSEQLCAFSSWVHIEGVEVRHVKPHGALYNAAVRQAEVARAVVRSVQQHDDRLQLFAASGSELEKAAEAAGVKVVREFFADRNYLSDGTLVPRTHRDAMINDPAAAAERLLSALKLGRVPSIAGADVTLAVETVCLHGDSPHAVVFARTLRERLEEAGVAIHSPHH